MALTRRNSSPGMTCSARRSTGLGIHQHSCELALHAAAQTTRLSAWGQVVGRPGGVPRRIIPVEESRRGRAVSGGLADRALALRSAPARNAGHTTWRPEGRGSEAAGRRPGGWAREPAEGRGSGALSRSCGERSVRQSDHNPSAMIKLTHYSVVSSRYPTSDLRPPTPDLRPATPAQRSDVNTASS
jgi:hypothetical protein